MIKSIYTDSLRGLINSMNELHLTKDKIISVFIDVQKRYVVIYVNEENRTNV